MNMNTIIYDCLNNVSWHCINCGMPQFSSSLFSSVDISTNNSYATLDDADIGPPNATSSPISSPTRVTQPKPKPWEKIQISIINFQSIKNKKAELLQKISQFEPTVIIGTETWLNPNIHSSEIFPPNYAVFRKDRGDGYGGVLIAVNNAYIAETVNARHPEVESTFVKIKIYQQAIIGRRSDLSPTFIRTPIHEPTI